MGTWLQWEGARLEGEGWQGIEYVALEGSVAGPVLEVKLNRPAGGLTAESFELGGGRQSRGLSWKVLSLNKNSDVVTLRLEDAGDDTHTYFVRLRDGGGLPLHPFFAMAEFSFAIDADRGDCRPMRQQARKLREKHPPVDLLTKDYTGFLNVLADRVRVINPHWADLSPASLERVLLELLSHHADLLSYYQDRVANEAFLDDATQRHSLRQHGLLLGYRLFDGGTARTIMAFEARSSGFLPAGLEVRMNAAADEARVVFHLMERTQVVAGHSRLTLAAWPGAFDAQVPAGATELLLWGQVEALRQGQRLALVQGAVAQLVEITEAKRLLLQGWVAHPAEPVPPPPLEARELTAVSFQPPLRTAVRPFAPDFALYGNLATARHGELRVAHYRPRQGRELPRGHILLREDRQNVVHQQGDEGRLLLRALRIPGAILFEPLEDGASAPLLELWVNGRRWSRVEHFHGSQPYHPHFVATSDGDGAVWLQFGDGVQGQALVDDGGVSLEIHFREGEPITGNCAPHTLTQVVLPEDAAERAQLAQLGLQRLTNVTPGTGGREPEAQDAARLAMPASLRRGALERAVSLKDCAEVARSVPGIANATARHLGGLFNTVLVLVEPEGQAVLTPELAATVRSRLERSRMAGREVRVAAPVYVPLQLRLALAVQPGALPHQVRDEAAAALRPGTLDRPGFFHPSRFGFGDDVELGEVLAHTQRVPGVRAVRALTFRRLFGPPSELLLTRIALGPDEVARLDGDEDFPEHGRLEVQVVESLPDVAERNPEPEVSL